MKSIYCSFPYLTVPYRIEMKTDYFFKKSQELFRLLAECENRKMPQPAQSEQAKKPPVAGPTSTSTPNPKVLG